MLAMFCAVCGSQLDDIWLPIVMEYSQASTSVCCCPLASHTHPRLHVCCVSLLQVAMHNYHLCTDSIKSSTMKIGYEIAGEALSSFFAALADMPPQPVDSFRTLAAYKSTIFDHMLRIKDVVMQQVEVEDMLEEIEVNYKDKKVCTSNGIAPRICCCC